MEQKVIDAIKEETNEAIQLLRDELSPIGAIQLFSHEHIPLGWMPCDGRKLKIDEYRELYYKITNKYGEVDNDEFPIPDLRDLFVRGWNPSSNRDLGSIQSDSLQKHGHKIPSFETEQSGTHSHVVKYDTRVVVTDSTWATDTTDIFEVGCTYPRSDSISYAGEHSHVIPATTARQIVGERGSTVGVADETRPKNICLLYCIKAKSECSTLRSEIEQLKKDKKAKEEECDSLKITNVILERQRKAAIDEKNAEEKEKLKWQSRCANYQRSEDALRKEKATLQIETISLQKKLDDECRIGWLWKACLALLLV